MAGAALARSCVTRGAQIESQETYDIVIDLVCQPLVSISHH
jgi:hypothetical protein